MRRLLRIGTSPAFLTTAKPTAISILLGSSPDRISSPKAGAKTLNLGAGFCQNLGRGRVGNPEIWAKPKRGAMHDGDALRFKKGRCKFLVVADHSAIGRFLTNRLRARR